MIRVVIFGVLAFVLGLGGSTGFLVMTAPAKPPGADSLAVAHPDSLHAKAAAPVVAAHAAADSAGHGAPAESSRTPDAALAAHTAPVPTVVVAPESGVHEGRSAPAPNEESFKQVGGILLNMKPSEAAKIIAYLSDDQLEGLMRSMSPRNAAVVLAQIPAERGAAISKRLLVPAPAKEARP